MNIDRLVQYLDEGRLLRGRWESTDARGRRMACAYAAMYSVGAQPNTCPAADMPQWFAQLIPSLDDRGTHEKWEPHMRLLAAGLRRTRGWSKEDWVRLQSYWLLIVLHEASRHTQSSQNLAALGAVLELVRRRLRGAEPTTAEWGKARDAAAAYAGSASAASAAYAAYAAAAAAAYAGYASAAYAGSAGSSAAASAASAAAAYAGSAAAAAAYAAYAGSSAAASAASADAWDRMTAGLLAIMNGAEPRLCEENSK